MPEVTAKTVLEEMRKTHKTLTTHLEKQDEEVRKQGDASIFTTGAIEKINAAITEQRALYDELLKLSQRPDLDSISSGPAETKEELELRSGFDKFLRFGMGENGRSHMSVEEQRALSSISDSSGGFLVPTSFESGLLTLAFNEAELRPLVQASATGRDAVQLAAISKPVVSWGTANLAISPQDLAAGGEKITIYDLKALTLIHNNTLEDADADVWNELLIQFSMALAEAEDDAIATGPGHNSLQGIISDSRVIASPVNTGVAGAISDASNNGVDALITMLQSLKKTYRRNSTWMMNSTTEGDVRKLKNDVGDYLWQPPVQPGNPSTLLGRPIVNPEGLPNVAANSLPIVLGDLKKGYKLRDRKGMTVQRLVERYAEFDQTGFIVKKRVGGQVTTPEAFKVLKVAI